jgi:hypothetical protein
LGDYSENFKSSDTNFTRTNEEIRFGDVILINNNVNIQIIQGALGKNGQHLFKYGFHEKNSQVFSLSELKEKCGGCDFLKIDCKGGEWYIQPEELNGIRRIEGEFHYFKGMKDKFGLLDYIKKNSNSNLKSSHQIWEPIYQNVRLRLFSLY